MSYPESERWHFGGRWYATTLSGSLANPDGMVLELEDVAPAPGRGIVLAAIHDDVSGEMAFISYLTEPLPFELVEQFIAEARRLLPPISG